MNTPTLAGALLVVQVTFLATRASGQSVEVERDRMTGREYSYAVWTAIDSVGHDVYRYLPALAAGCFGNGRMVVFVGRFPVQHENQRALVKWDAISEPKVITMIPSNVDQAMFFEDGPKAIREILLHTDTLLVRLRDVFGYVITSEFRLGSPDSVRTVLKSVADVCKWRMPAEDR